MKKIFCDDCKKEIKTCNICKNIFWTDEKEVNNCKNCIYNLEIEGVYSDSYEDDILIKCLKCNSYIPEIIKDNLCCHCGSIDKYWI